MIRRAFTMRLKPGALAEYKRHHDQIWPELVAQVERSGIAHISTFERDPDLFLFSEITDEEAWDRLWTSEIHRQWGELMEQFMHFKDGVVDFGELREIFHLETDAGRSAGGRGGKPTKATATTGRATRSSNAKGGAKKTTTRASKNKTAAKRTTRSATRSAKSATRTQRR